MTATMQQAGFEWAHKPHMRRSDFMESASNRDALGWVESWPEWGAPAIVIWGKPGSGKTHLSHIWAEKSSAAAIDPRLAEQDLMRIVLAQKNLILDAADQFGNDRLLFHILNAVKDRGGSLLMLAEKPASAWRTALPDLSSRLLALPQIEIFPPDDEMLKILMTKLFADRQLSVDAAVVDYAVRRLQRSYAAVRAFVDATDRFSLEVRRNITVSLVRQIIPELEQSFAKDFDHD